MRGGVHIGNFAWEGFVVVVVSRRRLLLLLTATLMFGGLVVHCGDVELPFLVGILERACAV